MGVSAEDILNLVLAASLIFANVMITVALRHMKQVKGTTIVFLAHLATSNLVQGVAFLANGLLGAYDAFTEYACMTWVILAVTPSGNYVTGIFFVYLDLYLSLKKMSIGKPIISTQLAIIMSLLAWVFWIGWCSMGFGMGNDQYVFVNEDGCSILVGAVEKEFILMVALSIFVMLVAILVLHVLTYRLIAKSRQQLIQVQNASDNEAKETPIQAIADDQAARRKEFKNKSKWVKKNDVVLKTITLIFVMLVISWYPVLITSVVMAYCKPCAKIVTKEVMYFTYVLVAMQYNSNGVIYLIKIKEFKQAMANLCCRCLPGHRRVEPAESSTGRI